MPLSLQRADFVRNANLIAGEWCAAADGRKFDVTEPAAGALITQAPDCSAADARAAADAAYAAFTSWLKVTLSIISSLDQTDAVLELHQHHVRPEKLGRIALGDTALGGLIADGFSELRETTFESSRYIRR